MLSNSHTCPSQTPMLSPWSCPLWPLANPLASVFQSHSSMSQPCFAMFKHGRTCLHFIRFILRKGKHCAKKNVKTCENVNLYYPMFKWHMSTAWCDDMRCVMMCPRSASSAGEISGKRLSGKRFRRYGPNFESGSSENGSEIWLQKCFLQLTTCRRLMATRRVIPCQNILVMIETLPYTRT